MTQPPPPNGPQPMLAVGDVPGQPYFRVIFAGDDAPIDVTTQAVFIAFLTADGQVMSVTRAPSLAHAGAIFKAAVIHAIEYGVIGDILRTILNPAEATRKFGHQPTRREPPPFQPPGGR